jgi:hypothetical protein
MMRLLHGNSLFVLDVLRMRSGGAFRNVHGTAANERAACRADRKFRNGRPKRHRSSLFVPGSLVSESAMKPFRTCPCDCTKAGEDLYDNRVNRPLRPNLRKIRHNFRQLGQPVP